jgi:RHS repeat-associated protein
MKEYMPGQGSYKVEEAGALTGIGTSYNVDNHWGTLLFDRDDVKISARGLDLALSSRFNSDHLYSTVITKVSKSDGPSGLASVAIPDSLMTLPADQTNFYRIANGWSWKLPYILLGTPNTFKFSLGDGRIFDLLATITQEAWGGTNGGTGWHSWTEGYEVAYAAESSHISLVTIVIPEVQATIVVEVQRSTGSVPYDFTPIWDATNLAVYLSDGRVLRFNSHGFLASVTDMAGKNTLTYSYMTDALVGTTGVSSSRKQFIIGASDYAQVVPGDLIVINGEIKVVFSKDDPAAYKISTSCNFDTQLTPGLSYTILKGQLQEITHNDGRAVKFYYYTSGANTQMVILLSSDPTMDNFVVGDEFLGCYTIVSSTNQLWKYQACSDLQHASKTGGFAADLAANQASYFGIMQTVTYAYNITNDPSPTTDTIIVTNNVGAPTIYYFQKGGFCSHSWNNAYFHRGACRRGGTKLSMNIERPDFYIQAQNYININRINDNAFHDASKADYQKDENAADFQSDNNFNTEMFAASTLLSVIEMTVEAAGTFGTSMIEGSAQLALSTLQYNHTQAKYAQDAQIAKNAGNVSAWVPVSAVTNPNRLVLSFALADYPRQNDVYAVLNAVPDQTRPINKTSKNSTRVYVDFTGSPNFAAGDFVFLRTECQVISDTGIESFGVGGSLYWIEVETPFQFMPDENEQVAFIYNNGGKLPEDVVYYAYYLNKPKVVRVEVKDATPLNSNSWTTIDYEYTYQVQGTQVTDSFIDGGFTQDHIEGPNNASFDVSDIALRTTVVTTSATNLNGSSALYRDTTSFSYDEKNFQKGEDSTTRMRLDTDSNAWFFVNKTVNSLGRPCFNAGYYGVISASYYEGGNVAIGGGAQPRKITDYRFDVYGRTVRTRVTSSFFEGKKTRSTWTQYVGSSSAISDLDPLGQFTANYLSGNYQAIYDAKHALGLVGATIEEVDTQGTLKCTYNGFDSATGNLITTDEVIITSLTSFADTVSINGQGLKANTPDGLHPTTDPSQIFWSYQGSQDSDDWSTALFDAASLTIHAITGFAYDSSTNNLLTITKPLGNTINMAYGSGWKSSYVVSDYKILDNNLGGTTQYVVTAYDYDIKGRLITKTVRLKSDTAANDTNLYVYGSSAPKTMSQYTYDGMDRLLTKIVGDGTTQTPVLAHQYFDAGDSSWVNLPYMIQTDYLGFRTKTYYDSRYRLMGTEKYKPNQPTSGSLTYSSSWEVKIGSEWNYYQPVIEKVGWNYKYTNPDEASSHAVVTQYTYDNIGRPTLVQQKNTDVTNYLGDSVYHTLKSISYDESANAVITQTFVDDVSGNFTQTRIENDWLGRGPVKEIAWTGLNATGVQRVTTSHYRHDGKLVRKDLPNKETFLYGYDNRGRLEKIVYPDGTRTAMLYDLNGNVIQTIDRRNISALMSYDKSDLVVQKTTADSIRGTTAINTTYTQFGPAKVAKTENALAIVENDFWYHFSGGVIVQQQIIDGYTMQIACTFDPAGNQLTVTPTGSGSSPWTKTFNILPQFHAANPDTDNFNRVAVADNSTGKNIITHEPDFLGLTKTIKYGDYASVVARMNHIYDKFLRVRTLISGESTPNLSITLTRDFIGRITSRVEPALSPAPAINNTYVYDGMDRLISGEGVSESYDELSNLITQGVATYVYQDPDDNSINDQMRLATFNNGLGTAFGYVYDANANPTSVSNKFTSLSYDNLNALRQIVYSQTDNYWYNGAGLRVKKTENAAGTWKTIYTLFDGDNPLMQEVYTASGCIQTTFNIIVGGRILAQYKMVYPSTSSVVYFYLDNLNSRRVVLSSSGTVVDRYCYSAWGVATQDVGSDDYRSFTGKDYDATGLIYFNARYYDPTTGRFLTEDPSRQGVNWYAYCGNNPINRVDLSGKREVESSNNGRPTYVSSSDSLYGGPQNTPRRQSSPSNAPGPSTQYGKSVVHALAAVNEAVRNFVAESSGAYEERADAMANRSLNDLKDAARQVALNYRYEAKGVPAWGEGGQGLRIVGDVAKIAAGASTGFLADVVHSAAEEGVLHTAHVGGMVEPVVEGVRIMMGAE